MMSLRQRIKTPLGILILSLFLVACTGGGDDNPNPDTTGGSTPISQTTRLQFWGVFWDNTIMDPLIAKYQGLNPNIEITYQNKWPGGDRSIASGVYKTQLERVLNTNDPDQIPDIFMVENTWAGNYDERYSIAAPPSVTDAASVEAQFYPAVMTDFVPDGQNVNGLPLWMDTLAIVYNKDLLEDVAVTSPPTDWVGFRNLASTLTKGGGSITQAGFAGGTTNNVDFAIPMLYLLMFQNDVNIVDAIGRPRFSSDPDAVLAAQFYLDFARSGVIGSWNSSQANDSLSFLQGDTAMIAVPSWRYNDILFFNDRYGLKLDIGVAPIPQIDPADPQNWATYWGAMVAKNRPNSSEAWRFISWLTQPEQLRELRSNDTAQRQFGFLYPRKDMKGELSFESNVSVFNDSLAHARSWYMIDGTKIEPIFQEMLNEGADEKEVIRASDAVQDVIDGKGLLLR